MRKYIAIRIPTNPLGVLNKKNFPELVFVDRVEPQGQGFTEVQYGMLEREEIGQSGLQSHRTFDNYLAVWDWIFQYGIPEKRKIENIF